MKNNIPLLFKNKHPEFVLLFTKPLPFIYFMFRNWLKNATLYFISKFFSFCRDAENVTFASKPHKLLEFYCFFRF